MFVAIIKDEDIKTKLSCTQKKNKETLKSSCPETEKELFGILPQFLEMINFTIFLKYKHSPQLPEIEEKMGERGLSKMPLVPRLHTSGNRQICSRFPNWRKPGILSLFLCDVSFLFPSPQEPVFEIQTLEKFFIKK